MGISNEQLEQVMEMAREYGVSRLILFGSMLDNPAEARDIDLACDGVPGWKLFELAARLEEELHMPLDLVSLTPSTRFTRLIEKRGRRLL